MDSQGEFIAALKERYTRDVAIPAG